MHRKLLSSMDEFKKMEFGNRASSDDNTTLPLEAPDIRLKLSTYYTSGSASRFVYDLHRDRVSAAVQSQLERVLGALEREGMRHKVVDVAEVAVAEEADHLLPRTVVAP